MMISFAQRAIVPADVMIREVSGESVFLKLDTESYFGLDDVGTQMWTALTESENIQKAYELLVNQYDVEPEILRQDLNRFIESLVSDGLLEIS